MNIYKKSHRKLFLTHIVMLVLFISGIALVWFALFQPSFYRGATTFPVILAIILILVSVYAVADSIQYRLILSDTEIREQSLFRTRTLPFDEVKGFHLTQLHKIRIEPKGYDKKILEIEKEIDSYDELLTLLSEKVPLLEDDREIDTVLKPHDNPNHMKLVRNIHIALNIITALCFGLSLWRSEFLFALVFMPVVTILTDNWLGLPIKVDKGGGKSPARISFMIFVAGLLFIICNGSYRHSSLDQTYWAYTVLFSAILVALALYFYRGAFKAKTWIVLVLFFGLHSATSVWLINCELDKPDGYYKNIPVVDKRASKGRHSSYYLHVRIGHNRFLRGESTLLRLQESKER